jgi:hypothetical protein
MESARRGWQFDGVRHGRRQPRPSRPLIGRFRQLSRPRFCRRSRWRC